jgi:hypothetical protein
MPAAKSSSPRIKLNTSGKTGSTEDTHMSLAIEDQPVVDEKIWRAWLQKGKLREETIARKAKVLTSVVSSRKKKTLQAEVRKHVEAGSAIYTDALKSYEGLNKFQHEVVDHAVEYVNGKVHTNGMENFWSLLKRGLNGTYVCPASTICVGRRQLLFPIVAS